MELALPIYCSFQSGLLCLSCEYGWQCFTESLRARFWAKSFNLGFRRPKMLPSSYNMVVSGKKSSLELTGLLSAGALRMWSPAPPSSVLTASESFSGCGAVVSLPRVHYCFPLHCEHLPPCDECHYCAEIERGRDGRHSRGAASEIAYPACTGQRPGEG